MMKQTKEMGGGEEQRNNVLLVIPNAFNRADQAVKETGKAQHVFQPRTSAPPNPNRAPKVYFHVGEPLLDMDDLIQSQMPIQAT